MLRLERLVWDALLNADLAVCNIEHGGRGDDVQVVGCA